MNSSWFQASRLPPSMPSNIAARSASPRNGATVRSETPERGTIDNAHIDSPAHPYPLRESRSPGISARSHSPFCPSSPQIPSNNRKPPHSSQGPRGASPGLPNSSRPPLACRVNDENVAPSNTADGDHRNMQKDAKEDHATTPSTTTSSLRVQAATCGNGFPRVNSERGMRSVASYVTPRVQPTTPRPMSAFSSARDLSPVGIPLHGSHRPAPPPPSVPPPPSSTRSASQVKGASPRMQGSTCPATPTQTSSTNKGVVRSLSARGPIVDAEPRSPDFGARNALTPCAADKDGERPSRTPLQLTGRRQEHCASSPALILDMLSGCGASKTPPQYG